MDDVCRTSPEKTKKDTSVSGGSWEGVGSLVAGGEAFFLAKDAFGHDDGNRAIVAGYFC